MDPITLIIILTVATSAVLVYGVHSAMTRNRTLLADRVETYAAIEEEAAISATQDLQGQSIAGRLFNLVLGRGYIDKIQEDLTRADVPMKPAEYILARLALAGVGAVVGFFILGYPHSGVLLACFGFFVPAMAVRYHQNKRRDKFVRQLADALMLLTNSLRSGYSFLKGLELVAKEMSDPISKELHRTLREVNLGATIEDAMQNLGRRVHSKDLDIVISAYLVQKEVGGNLTEIMQKVAETIRERLRIQGDIKVLTAQGRLSGLFVGFLPLIVGILIFLSSPSYFAVLLGEPKKYIFGFGWLAQIFFDGPEFPYGILLLAGGAVWQLIGAYLIYKIISIKV